MLLEKLLTKRVHQLFVVLTSIFHLRNEKYCLLVYKKTELK